MPLPAGPIEPLPDVSTSEIVGLLELLHQRAGEEDIVRIAEATNQEFGRIILVVKAAELLGFVDTPLQMVVLTAKGRRFVEARVEERKLLWQEQLLTLQLFREVYEVVQRQPGHSIDSDFVLETIIAHMPYENYEKIFNTFIRWARFGELFTYDEASRQVTRT